MRRPSRTGVRLACGADPVIGAGTDGLQDPPARDLIVEITLARRLARRTAHGRNALSRRRWSSAGDMSFALSGRRSAFDAGNARRRLLALPGRLGRQLRLAMRVRLARRTRLALRARRTGTRGRLGLRPLLPRAARLALAPGASLVPATPCGPCGPVAPTGSSPRLKSAERSDPSLISRPVSELFLISVPVICRAAWLGPPSATNTRPPRPPSGRRKESGPVDARHATTSCVGDGSASTQDPS